MAIRFHESLQTFLDVLSEKGLQLNDSSVIVRDAAGHLLLAQPELSDTKDLELELRARLGKYIGPVAVLSGIAAKRLSSDPTVRTIRVGDAASSQKIRFADRRIVGMDWLRKPTAIASAPKRLVFGSLKGGVGRSTALAVVAADLARAGKKVLAIDLDLEAPGIGFMLLPNSDEVGNDRRPKFGVIDYLLENNLSGIADEDLDDFIGVSPFADGSIDVIPAIGRETDDRPETMIAKLSRALIEDNDGKQVIPVALQVRKMVDRFCAHKDYDAVLVDARAGLSEITAAPLLSLGAELLMFGVDQPQTFRGYAYMLTHLVLVSGVADGDQGNDWRYHLSFVQSKASASSAKRAPFRERLYDLCATYLYEEEIPQENGDVIPAEFAPGPDETGQGVPHDALYIQFHPDYDAFDPIADKTQLDPDVYRGPFGAFLERAWEILELKPVS